MDKNEFNQIDQIRKTLDEIPMRKAGRPRKHKAEYIDAQAQKLNEWLDNQTVESPLWLKAYCLFSGLSYAQLRNFEELSPLYKKAMERARTMQEVSICKWAERAKNPAFPIFALKAHHGWKDGNQKEDKQVKRGAYTDSVKDTPEDEE